jgi:hypothetical protein
MDITIITCRYRRRRIRSRFHRRDQGVQAPLESRGRSIPPTAGSEEAYGRPSPGQSEFRTHSECSA